MNDANLTRFMDKIEMIPEAGCWIWIGWDNGRQRAPQESEMKEDKVNKTLESIKDYMKKASDGIIELNSILNKAIATEPEIPEGCPVLVWDRESQVGTQCAFYVGYTPETQIHSAFTNSGFCLWGNAEIDYQRKGHVIPWSGGECPVDDDAEVTVTLRDGSMSSRCAEFLRWKYGSTYSINKDIIAYVIWPEWVKL